MIELDLEGLAPDEETESDRQHLQAKFAELQTALAGLALPMKVWVGFAALIEMAHLLGIREHTRTTLADLKNVVREMEQRIDQIAEGK